MRARPTDSLLSYRLKKADLVGRSGKRDFALIPDSFKPSVKLSVTYGLKEVSLGNELSIKDTNEKEPGVGFVDEVSRCSSAAEDDWGDEMHLIEC